MSSCALSGEPTEPLANFLCQSGENSNGASKERERDINEVGIENGFQLCSIYLATYRATSSLLHLSRFTSGKLLLLLKMFPFPAERDDNTKKRSRLASCCCCCEVKRRKKRRRIVKPSQASTNLSDVTLVALPFDQQEELLRFLSGASRDLSLYQPVLSSNGISMSSSRS